MSCEFKEYDRLGHTLAPYELEHCGVGDRSGRRRARTTRPGGEDGWLSGDGDGYGAQEQVVLRRLQPLLQIAAAAACSCSYRCDKPCCGFFTCLLVMKLVFPAVRKERLCCFSCVLQPAACWPFKLELMTVCSSEMDGLSVVLSGPEIGASCCRAQPDAGRGWAITIKPIAINHQFTTRNRRRPGGTFHATKGKKRSADLFCKQGGLISGRTPNSLPPNPRPTRWHQRASKVNASMAAAAERPSAGGFVLWLHGSGGSGDESRAQVAPYFSAPDTASSVRLSFPTAPTASIPCYGDAVITAWFGISEVPITAKTVRDEKEVLKAVEYVHELIDKEVAAGTSPSDIFVCGMSQGGALAIASVLLYPKTLGGCAVFSGSVPLNKSFAEKVSSEARKTPVLWFHGMADGLVLFEAGHAGCAFLEKLGMSCEFKAYPTLGHSMVDEELQYFQQWILNRLGMAVSRATETARPSSSSNHKDLQ